MGRLIWGIFVILLINLEVNGQLPFSISDIWTVIKWCNALAIKGIDYKSAANTIYDSKGEEFEKMMNEVRKVSNQLKTFARKIDQKLDSVLNTLLNNLRDNINLQLAKVQLNDLFNSVDRLHNQAMKLQIQGKFVNKALKNFVELVLWNSDSLSNTLEQIKDIILPKNHFILPSFTQLMIKDAQDNIPYDCSKYISAQQRVYYIYIQIILAEMKGLATLTYVYSILQIFDRSYDYNIELQNAKDIFQKRVQNYHEYIIEEMASFPRVIYQCDVNPLKRGIDFFELYKFSRAAIFNERELTSSLRINPRIKGHCSFTCDEINYNLLGADAQALGRRIYNCDEFGGTKPGEACPAPEGSHREYMWWKNVQGTYGRDTDCDEQVVLFGFRGGYPESGLETCAMCVCSLDMNTIENISADIEAIASISITPQVADIANNMVVTGVKFMVQDHAVHMRIQQNKFSPGGIADNNSSWKWPGSLNQISEHIFQYEKLEYAAFDHEWKSLHLDDIILPDNYVVTGLQFERENLSRSFRLKIHGTPFDFNTGLLNSSGSQWFNSDDDETASETRERKKIELVAPDDPTRCQNYNYDRGTHKSIEFVHTDIRKDAGQNTVPFFDAQPVDTQPAFPLNGIGLFHRTRDGFGGYIAPRIFTIDVHKHFKLGLNKSTNISTSRLHN